MWQGSWQMDRYNNVLDMTTGITVKDKLYFKTYRAFPGLYCYDILQKKMYVIDEPRELNASWKRYSYNGASKADKYIIFIPYYGNYFIFLNTENNEILYFEKKKNSVYYDAAEYEQRVFVFADRIENIIVFDLKNFSYYYPFEKQSFSVLLLCAKAGVKESTVIITTEKADYIAEIDLKLCRVHYKNIKERGIHYNIVITYKDGYILAGDKPTILLWDGKENYQYIDLEEKWIRHDEIAWKMLFTNAIILNKKVYFGPLNYKKMVSLDLENMQVEYCYEVQKNEIASLIKIGNEILLSSIEDDEPRRNQIYTEGGKIIEGTAFEMNDSIKLSGSEMEYSGKALKYFLEDITKCC